MEISVSPIGLQDYPVAYKSLLHMLYVENTALVMESKAVRGLHFSHTNRANIIKRDLTMRCDNTINEIWSN